ncbi:MAG: cysteine-rich CWC family protein [Ideonella sp.]|nr:cysteine-rich CWC family protein [Ideonella sp.]
MADTPPTVTPPPSPLANHRCPLCGGPNACAPAACGRFDVDCWCREASFGAALLARVPAAARGLACVCKRCAGEASSA